MTRGLRLHWRPLGDGPRRASVLCAIGALRASQSVTYDERVRHVGLLFKEEQI